MRSVNAKEPRTIDTSVVFPKWNESARATVVNRRGRQLVSDDQEDDPAV